MYLSVILLVLIGCIIYYVVAKSRKPRLKTSPATAPDLNTNTTVVHIDVDAILTNVKKTEARRERLKNNPPKSLSPGSIKTIDCVQKHNPTSLSKYPVYYLKGSVGSDYIETFINTNPKSKYISFYVNGRWMITCQADDRLLLPYITV
jgi:hypothetical protein